MLQEIERKFLVKGEFKPFAVKSIIIKQGYLNSTPERTVRVRIAGDKAYITIKGIGNQNGTSRFEWEKEILVEEANELLNLAEPGIIEKTRYLVPASDRMFEVDELHGANEGLTVAEIELSSEDEKFDKPDWLGEEVTGDPKYYNSMLNKNFCRNNNP